MRAIILPNDPFLWYRDRMQNHHRWNALAGAALGAVVACGPPAASRPADPMDAPLDNERYTILQMATAHGAFTIELEVDADSDTETIARQLVEPMKGEYSEVLVYFFDRAGDRSLPMKRVQWTEADGYIEIEY